jgi:uncharacterized protein (TIGR02594 family)
MARVLKLGMSGDDVKKVQLALASLGFPLRGTGYFGNATDTAVTAFQQLHDLTDDGVVGKETLAQLILALSGKAPTSPVEVGSTSRPLWLQAGIPLINVKEAGNNPEILEWAREEGGEIAKEYKSTGIPWCALFANHLLTKVGLKGTETLWALDFAGHWPSKQLAGPAVGAFAPMKRTGGGHIICIVGKDQNGNVMGLGGNQSDQVSIVPFPLARLNQGFWWPESATLPAAVGMKSLPLVRSNGQLSSKEA